MPNLEERKMMEPTNIKGGDDKKPHAEEQASPVMGFGEKQKDKRTIDSEKISYTTSDREKYKGAKKAVAEGTIGNNEEESSFSYSSPGSEEESVDEKAGQDESEKSETDKDEYGESDVNNVKVTII
jgi:hypothetical protein